MMPAVVLAAAAFAVGLLAGCSNDPSDYRDGTENELEETDGEIVSEYGQVFTNAECEEPSSIDVGTTYTCTALGEDGVTWIFDVEIDGENSYTVKNGTAQD